MKMHKLILTSVTVLLAASLIGCSSESPVTPTGDAAGLVGPADKGEAAVVTIRGTVYDLGWHGLSGVPVRVDYCTWTGNWYTLGTVVTGTGGHFSIPATLYSVGYPVRCSAVGDIETLNWDGGHSMQFVLQEQRPGHQDDLPMELP